MESVVMTFEANESPQVTPPHKRTRYVEVEKEKGQEEVEAMN